MVDIVRELNQYAVCINNRIMPNVCLSEEEAVSFARTKTFRGDTVEILSMSLCQNHGDVDWRTTYSIIDSWRVQ